MKENQTAFDKSKFAELLLEAKGDRSINQYWMQSGVSATYISKLLRSLVDTPPGVEVIRKLADKAHNGVTYEDLMKAAGHLSELNLGFGSVHDKENSNLLDLPENLLEFLLQHKDRHGYVEGLIRALYDFLEDPKYSQKEKQDFFDKFAIKFFQVKEKFNTDWDSYEKGEKNKEPSDS